MSMQFDLSSRRTKNLGLGSILILSCLQHLLVVLLYVTSLVRGPGQAHNKWVQRSTLVILTSRLRVEQEDLDTGVNAKWEILYRTFEKPYFLASTLHESKGGAAIHVV